MRKWTVGMYLHVDHRMQYTLLPHAHNMYMRMCSKSEVIRWAILRTQSTYCIHQFMLDTQGFR